MAESIVEEPTNFFASSSSTLSSQEGHHQEEEQPQEEQEQPSSPATTTTSMIFLKIISKRRTWVCLFVFVYTVLLALSWNFLKSVLSWYESTMLSSSSSGGGERVSYYSGWAALYGSMLLGLAFGVLSMVAALAVVVPATLVTWISILVLLTFFGKPRRALVLEGKKLTIDIIGFVLKVLIKEGNIVAALCAVLGYFAFVKKSKEDGRIPPAAVHL